MKQVYRSGIDRLPSFFLMRNNLVVSFHFSTWPEIKQLSLLCLSFEILVSSLLWHHHGGNQADIYERGGEAQLEKGSLDCHPP
jgi:hypothetical protein